MQTRLNVLFAGPLDDELCPALESLRPLACVVTAADLEAACQMLRDGFAADVIVLAQQRRGQWSEEAVEELRRAAPLAPVIGLLGSWSAATARSGRMWPGAIHVSVQRWENEILPGFKQLLSGECPWWARPGAEDDERRFRMVGAKPGKCTSIVAISALSRESEQWLADACRLGQHAVLILRPDLRENRKCQPIRGVTAMVWECPELRPDEEAPWRAVAEALGAPPVLLLQNFPRQADDVPRPGVAAVLAKPFTLSALLEHLDRLVLSRQLLGGSAGASPSRLAATTDR